LKSEIRQRVQFQQANLIHDPAPFSSCHVIFCRNVLIYFEPETIAAVMHKLATALVEGGYLVLGVAELPRATLLDVEWVDSHQITLLRRPIGGATLKAVAPPPKPAI